MHTHTYSRATERGGAATRNVGGSTGFTLGCVCVTAVQDGVGVETGTSEPDGASVGHTTMRIDRL